MKYETFVPEQRMRSRSLMHLCFVVAGALLASSLAWVAPASATTTKVGDPGCLVGQVVSSYKTAVGCGPEYYEVENLSSYVGANPSTGSLPPGISRVPYTTGPGGGNGYFTGNYTTAGRYIWNHNYRENSGDRTREYFFTIWDAPPVFAAGAQTTTGTVGVNIPFASGYVLPFSQYPNTFVYSGLPPGMDLYAKTGVLYGKPTQAGTYTVNVTGSNSFGSASGTIEITIAPGAQTLSFTNPGAKTMSTTPFALTVTASSGLTPTVASTTPSVCSVDGLNLTMLGIGTCTLRASQAGNESYAAATDVPVSFNISKGTQAPLILTSVTGSYGSPITLTTSGGSGSGAVSFVVNSQGTTGCSLASASSTDLQFTAPGTCTVTATKALDSNFNVVASASTAIVIGKGTQADLLLTSISGTFGTALPLVSSGGSGVGVVSFVVTSAGTAGCSLATSTSLTSTGGGTCSVRVNKASDTNYNAISSAITTVTFAARTQTSDVLMTSSGVKTYGSDLTLGSTGGSGSGGLSYSVVDAGSANCSVSDSSLSSTGDVGSTCTVKATRGADTSYLALDSSIQTITVANKAVQPTVTVMAPTVAYRTPVMLSSSGGAGTGGVSFTVTTVGTAGCSVTSGELRSTGDVGSTCGVTATKATSTNYLVASSVELTVTITEKATQVITFAAPSDRVYADPTFTVSPSSDSGLTVTVASSTPLVCTVSGLSVSVHLPGTCTLTAAQSGDGNYLAALPVIRSFEVTRAAQTVTWNPLVGVSSTSSPVTMSTAIGSDGGTVTYSVLDQGTTNCVIADPNLPVVTFDAAGACAVRAEADVTDTHLSGTSMKILVISTPVPSAGPAAAGDSATSGDASLLVVAVRSLDPIRAHAGLIAGDHRVVVDGKPIPVRIEANATNTGLDVFGANWRIQIVGLNADGSPLALAPGDVLSLTVGAQLRVSGSGFEELAQVRIYLMNQTLLLGSLMTDRSGDFEGVLDLPVDVASSVDTLQINGFTTNRMVRSLSLGVSIKEAQDMSTAIGSRIYFRYKSAALTTKAKKSLMNMLAKLPEGATVQAAIRGSVRSKGATYSDRRLAKRRTVVVQTFLQTHGFIGHVSRSIGRVTVPKGYLETRVYVTLKQRSPESVVTS